MAVPVTVHRIGDHHTTQNADDKPHIDAPWDEPDEPPRPMERLFWERYIRRSGLPPTTKLVALTMATYSDAKGAEIFPGDDNLAADCGITKRSVITHRQTLERLGFILRVSDARRGRAAEFILSWPPNFNRLPGSRGPDGGPPLDL